MHWNVDEEITGEGDVKVQPMNVNSVKSIQPTLKVHTFMDKILDCDVYFHVTKLCESFYIWVGKSAAFGDLSVAMTIPGRQTSSTVLIGGTASPTDAMAQRLSKKTGKQVFVGGDLNCFDQLSLPLMEKRIADEMKTSPDHF